MAASNQFLEQIKSALAKLATDPLRGAATELMRTLGYRSDRTLQLSDSSPKAFLDFIQASPAHSQFDAENQQNTVSTRRFRVSKSPP